MITLILFSFCFLPLLGSPKGPIIQSLLQKVASDDPALSSKYDVIEISLIEDPNPPVPSEEHVAKEDNKGGLSFSGLIAAIVVPMAGVVFCKYYSCSCYSDYYYYCYSSFLFLSIELFRIINNLIFFFFFFSFFFFLYFPNI